VTKKEGKSHKSLLAKRDWGLASKRRIGYVSPELRSNNKAKKDLKDKLISTEYTKSNYPAHG